jgi:hypothetical protein
VRGAGDENTACDAIHTNGLQQAMRSQDVCRKRRRGIAPRFGDLRQPRAVKDRRRLQLANCGVNRIAIQQIYALPSRAVGDLCRRR